MMSSQQVIPGQIIQSQQSVPMQQNIVSSQVYNPNLMQSGVPT